MALSLQSLLAFLVLLTFLASPAVAQRPSEYSRNYTYTRRVYTPTVSTILPSTRFRYECRNVFPIRADIVPHGVVFSGYVEDIKQDTNDEEGYQASVTVRRVFYGPRNLRRSRVTVAGLGGNKTNWCFSNVHRGDSWIFVLQPITYPDYFRLSSSLIKINLANLEKIEGIVADEPYRKMTTVTDRKYLD